MKTYKGIPYLKAFNYLWENKGNTYADKTSEHKKIVKAFEKLLKTYRVEIDKTAFGVQYTFQIPFKYLYDEDCGPIFEIRIFWIMFFNNGDVQVVGHSNPDAGPLSQYYRHDVDVTDASYDKVWDEETNKLVEL